MKIDYALTGDGRASVHFTDGAQAVKSRITNQHDSLLDLARVALSLRDGERSARAVFVVDPGEIHLAVEVEEDRARYEVRQFSDWASLNRQTSADYEVLLRGDTTVVEIVRQLTNLLTRIHDDLGTDRYKAMWQQHDFPQQELARLVSGPAPESVIINLLIRAFLIVVIAPAVYIATYWICSVLFYAYNIVWVPHTIALLFALEAAWVTWTRTRPLESATGRSRAVAIGALLLGGTGIALGFYIPVINTPGWLQGTILGVLIAAPSGLLLGGIGGYLWWKWKTR